MRVGEYVGDQGFPLPKSVSIHARVHAVMASCSVRYAVYRCLQMTCRPDTSKMKLLGMKYWCSFSCRIKFNSKIDMSLSMGGGTDGASYIATRSGTAGTVTAR